jgi:hypothetical protein
MVFLNERFPTAVRASGTSLSWNLGFALGGLAPIFVSLDSGSIQGLQTTLDRDSLAAEAMQTRVNSLITDFINRDDPAQKAVIARNRDQAMAELARLKLAVVAEQKAIADFQEEARRAGVPPGWLR